MFAKIKIAQAVVTVTVSAAAAAAINKLIANHTEYDEDGVPVQLVSAVGGCLVAQRVKPQTDAAVVMAANVMSKIKIRKDKTTEETETQE